jgi:hypothetical protein
MRVSVSLIVNLVATGMNTEEIIEAYPDLEPDDVRQTRGSLSFPTDMRISPNTIDILQARSWAYPRP